MAAALGDPAVSGVASKVAESAFDVIGRHISYVFKYQNHMDELKKQVEQDLTNKRQRVEVDVNNAGQQGEEVYNDVIQWLADVNKFTEEVANPIIGEGEKAKKPLCKGLCTNYIKRYKLSKKAIKAAQAGADLLGKGNFSRVSYRPPLQRSTSKYVRGYEGFDSRDSNLKDIIEALKDADSKIIGVWGMGGVGKTTLVKKVAAQVVKEKLFDTVLMAEVAQTIDYKQIQDEIACDLGLDLGQQSVFERARRLRDRLKKEKRVLIILDNLWEKVNLESVGIFIGDFEKGNADKREEFEKANAHKEKEQDGNPRRCKILLTSREKNLLIDKMETKKNIVVSPLSREEALNWFLKIVGDSADKSGLHSTAVNIVEKCAGLPLAITTIATRLKEKSLDLWDDALNQLERCYLGDPSDPSSVHSIIRWSYDLMKNKPAKLLFRLCGLFSAGYSIHIDDLLCYGMGLGLLENYNTLGDGRKRLHKLIDDLKASCLLLDDDHSQRFKMHDIIHSVAVSIASADSMFNLQNVPYLKDKLEDGKYEDSTAIAMPSTDIPELPERLNCPKLKLFLLFAKKSSPKIPCTFFEGMKELKILDSSSVYFSLPPSSLCHLANLQTLRLNNCQLEGNIGRIAELRKLEILSFSGSNIKLLPQEIVQLTRLKLLNLGDCSQLERITPNVISSLSRLEELYLNNSFTKWEVEGPNNQERRNASLVELKQLSCMTTLMIHLHDAKIMPQDLFSQEKLERFRIFIGDVWSWSERHESTRMLKLKLTNNIHLRPGIKMLLKKAEDLSLDELGGVRDDVCELDGEGFRNLKNLHVQNGPELLYVVNSMGKVIPYNAFPVLESLFLDNLIKLDKICQGQLSKGSFSKLKLLEVCKCGSLSYIFTPPVVMGLEQLQKMTIKECDMLEEIIAKEGEKDSAARDKIIFRLLDAIILDNLRNLKVFYSESNILEFPSLKSITIHWCPKMETFVYNDMKELHLHPAPLFSDKVALPALESLDLYDCSGFQCLFTSSIVKSPSQLKTLKINGCEAMQAVLVVNEGRVISEMQLFPRLQELELRYVPKLTRFCNFSGDLIELSDTQPFFDKQVRLPSLGRLIVFGMSDNLRKLWPNKLSLESFGKLKELRIGSCKSLEEIVSCMEELTIAKEEVAEAVPTFVFPHLVSLELYELPNLTNFYPKKHISKLPKLEDLGVYSCNQMQILMGLQDICGESLNAISIQQPFFLVEEEGLPSLKTLTIYDMDDLRKLWPNKLKSFDKLEYLRVNYCKPLEEIVYCMEAEDVAKEEAVGVVPTFVFPHLIFLRLWDLPNLTNFYPRKHISKWSKLEDLMVWDCDKVQILMGIQDSCRESQNAIPIRQPLFSVDKVGLPSLKKLDIWSMGNLRKIWQNEPSLEMSLGTLEDLEVESCNKLVNIFSYDMIGGLQRLNALTVSDCESLEEIVSCMEEETIAKGEVEEAVPTIVFPQLNSLTLDSLPNLTNFYPKKHISKWPMLKSLLVERCDKVEIFASEFLILQDIHGESPHEIPLQQPLFFFNTVLFPRLKELGLSGLPNSLHLWRTHSQPIKVFQNLRTLRVSCSTKLETVLPSTVNFQNLTTLKVFRCCQLINLMTFSTVKSLVRNSQVWRIRCREIIEEVTAGSDGMIIGEPTDLRLNNLDDES